ncbi:MAG TPA: hypothetical protein VM737_07485 [Gemmatimonadota bacterium]|nr:hypothetical protein [Gemmatimonadota bacterium]
MKRWGFLLCASPLLVAPGCAGGRSPNPPAETVAAYHAEVAAEMNGALAGLDQGARDQLQDLLPLLASTRTWQGVLAVLDERPALVPLSTRTGRVIERRASGGVRLEVDTPSGNRALRDLLIEEIREFLATAAAG